MSIGFSTGAIALGEFRVALQLLRQTPATAVELSAIRVSELPPLIAALPELDLSQFRYISLHAPSRFSAGEEEACISLLGQVPKEWPIVLHPDAISDALKWSHFGGQLAIENMDRRKSDGKSARELFAWFERLPEARLCFDLAHARQCDPTMTEAFRILDRFGHRLAQIHISELDSASRHYRLSSGAVQAYAEVAWMISEDIPIIIESRVLDGQIDQEIENVKRALFNPAREQVPA